jgi:3-phenylpropionate/trans-cinnamate dioxygenase ferredoxin reductase subunit
LRHARVVAIDRTAKRLVVTDRDHLPYDRLVLAVGSRSKKLSVPGAALGGIHYLRTIQDSLVIGRELSTTGHLMVIGGGWIGLEVASAARKSGMSVTIVECSDRLCCRMLPRGELAGYLLDLHRRKGVNVRLNETAHRIWG